MLRLRSIFTNITGRVVTRLISLVLLSLVSFPYNPNASADVILTRSDGTAPISVKGGPLDDKSNSPISVRLRKGILSITEDRQVSTSPPLAVVVLDEPREKVVELASNVNSYYLLISKIDQTTKKINIGNKEIKYLEIIRLGNNNYPLFRQNENENINDTYSFVSPAGIPGNWRSKARKLDLSDQNLLLKQVHAKSEKNELNLWLIYGTSIGAELRGYLFSQSD